MVAQFCEFQGLSPLAAANVEDTDRPVGQMTGQLPRDKFLTDGIGQPVKTFPPLVLNSGEFTPVRAGCPGAAGKRIMALYEDRSIRADDCSIRSS